ncbi:MAG: ankyrin repeat domain-containing protein, partial [Actinomycetota bacterium]
MSDLDDDRVQPALHAMLADDVEALRSTIDADPEIALKPWNGNTLLEWTTQPPHHINPAIVTTLIDAGSPVDRALNLAGCWNLAELCTQLLDAGANPENRADADITPLESAALHGATRSADVLVTHGLHRHSLWLA